MLFELLVGSGHRIGQGIRGDLGCERALELCELFVTAIEAIADARFQQGELDGVLAELAAELVVGAYELTRVALEMVLDHAVGANELLLLHTVNVRDRFVSHARVNSSFDNNNNNDINKARKIRFRKHLFRLRMLDSYVMISSTGLGVWEECGALKAHEVQMNILQCRQ